MKEAIKRVQTGMVTYATRDTVIKGNDVKQGQYLALTGDEILSSGESLHQTAIDLVKTITAPYNDLITVFYGQDVERDQAVRWYRLSKSFSPIWKLNFITAVSQSTTIFYRSNKPSYPVSA
jgi:uncharacterized protein